MQTHVLVTSIDSTLMHPGPLCWQRSSDHLEKTAGPPSQRLAHQCPGGCRRYTAVTELDMVHPWIGLDWVRWRKI